MQRVQMAGHRLTDPVLSGRPQNLNPPQVLSAPNPPHLSPEGAFALTSVLASIVMRRPLHASYLLVSHSPLPPIQVLYHTSDHGIGFPRTKPLTPYHTAPCMAITSCLTALPKLCHRHHRWATNPPPLSPVTDDRCLKQIHTSLYLFCQYHFHHN